MTANYYKPSIHSYALRDMAEYLPSATTQAEAAALNAAALHIDVIETQITDTKHQAWALIDAMRDGDDAAIGKALMRLIITLGPDDEVTT